MPVTINGTTGVVGPDGSASTPSYQGTDSNTGIFFPAADTIAFAEGGTEVMRIDSSGNVGIGTSSPGYKLDVTGVTRVTSSLVTNSDLQVNPSGYNLYLRNISGTNRIDSYNSPITATVPLGLNASVLTFSIADTERARIDSSGNLLVGTTTVASSAKMTVSFAGGSGSSRGLVMLSGSTASTAMIAFQNPNGYAQGEILTSGTTTSYNTSSDYRLKEAVQPMTGALAKVAALKPVTYRWKVDGSDGEGFIAHELAEVCPGAVTGEKDAVNEDGSIKPQGIDTSFLSATLAAALQELHQIVQAQAAEIAELKAKLP